MINFVPLAAIESSSASSVGTAATLIFLAFFLVIAIFWLATMLFWVWTIIDCIKRNEFKLGGQSKAIWLVVLIVFGVLASIAYYLIEMRDNSWYPNRPNLPSNGGQIGQKPLRP
ncbi:MAG: PLDc N-terminal domain-containing protein [Candidatus Diapherotrites archaeon]|nr:PLDc N-terminal domain-containing protein [Candidatus Diapherotrites archaeon]